MEWSEICEGINKHKRGSVVKDIDRKENGMLSLVQTSSIWLFLQVFLIFSVKMGRPIREGGVHMVHPPGLAPVWQPLLLIVLPNQLPHLRTSYSLTWI